MPFQSRLINTTIRQVQRWQDRVGHLWRQVKLQATWGVEVLLYPLTRIGRSLKYGLEQHQSPSIADGANAGGAKQSSPSKIIRLFKRVGQRFFRTGLAPLGRLRQRPSLHQYFTKPLQSYKRLKQSATCAQAQPESSAPTLPAATALVNRAMAWVKHLGGRLQAFSARLPALEPSQDRAGLAHHNSYDHPVKGNTSSNRETFLSWLRAAINHFFGKDASGAQTTLSGTDQKLEGNAESKQLPLRNRLKSSAAIVKRRSVFIIVHAIATACSAEQTILFKHLAAPLRKVFAPIAVLKPNQGGGTLDVQRLEGRLAPSWESVASKSEALLGWIKAAINHFFGEGVAGAQTRLPDSSQQLEDLNTPTLPTTSFSMALLPGVGNLVRTVWQVIRRSMDAVMPWLGRDLTLPMTLPLVPAPSGRGIAQPKQSFDLVNGPFLQSRPSLADASQRGSYSDGGTLTAPTEAQLPLQTTLIEVTATVVGYIESPLGQLWAWLDRAIRWLEDILIDGCMWLWRWIQQVKRYCLFFFA